VSVSYGCVESKQILTVSSQEAISKGPPGARVERVDITEEVEIGQCQFAKFEIRH
jgi:hypothetical protein